MALVGYGRLTLCSRDAETGLKTTDHVKSNTPEEIVLTAVSFQINLSPTLKLCLLLHSLNMALDEIQSQLILHPVKIGARYPR